MITIEMMILIWKFRNLTQTLCLCPLTTRQTVQSWLFPRCQGIFFVSTLIPWLFLLILNLSLINIGLLLFALWCSPHNSAQRPNPIISIRPTYNFKCWSLTWIWVVYITHNNICILVSSLSSLVRASKAQWGIWICKIHFFCESSDRLWVLKK